ncbi:DUF1877 family protein [Streptomyces sp. NPDC003943]
MHLHFRAAAETEIRDDYPWLVDFMGRAWEAIEAEYAAGVADAIEKDFGRLHELYERTGHPDAFLPVFGGGPPAATPTDVAPHPPLMLMPPSEVAGAAAFLTGLAWDDFWSREGERVRASFGPGWDLAEVHDIFRSHHQSLRRFYERAAAAGHTVVKAGWF